MARPRILSCLLAICLGAMTPALQAQSCGVERWSVKTGTDPDAGLVNLSAGTSNTIATLRGWPTPSPIPANNRVAPYETTEWVLNATLTSYKSENDSDYHLVLQDAAGNTMIAEIPSPACVGSSSPFLSGITHARSQFDAVYTATSSFQTANVPVRITGIGMFDFLHGQTGVAPNGIELHPVIDIIFNPSASNTVSASITTPSSNLTVASGTSVAFSGAATDSSSSATLSYAWGFGDGGTAGGTSAAHVFTNTGTSNAVYTVTFTATDNTGASSTATRTVTVTPATGGGGGGGTTTQILGNPGFETGTASPWAMTSGVLDNGTSEPAHAGSWKAWMCGYGSVHTDTVMQQASLSGSATAASLSFWLHIDTAETGSTVHDTLAVQVRNSAGTVLATLATYSNLNAASGYTLRTFDLSAYKGQTIQVNLVGTEDAANQTSFVVDDFALNVTTGSGGGTNTVTASISSPASDVTIPSGTTQAFTGVATDSSSTATLSYAWAFGDGATATGTSVSHTYTNTGTVNAVYTVTLTVTDSTGVKATATRGVTVTPPSGGGSSQIVVNPGFESGTTGWAGTLADIGAFSGEPAHTGSNDCWLLGTGSTATESIAQTVSIPSTAVSASLSFWLHIDTAETGSTAYDTLAVQVKSTSGTVLGTLATYSNVNSNTGYTLRTFDLSAYKGQTIQLSFLGNEDASNQTSFVLDDITLTVQ